MLEISVVLNVRHWESGQLRRTVEAGQHPLLCDPRQRWI